MTPRFAIKAVAVAAAAAISIGLAGCSGNSGSSETLEIQTGQAVNSELFATLKSVAADFEKANPDVKLDLVASPGEGYEKNMKVRLASGDIPDIWWTHGWSRDRYSQFLMPLQDEPWAESLNPVLDSAMRDSDGAFYAMPVDTNIAGILYNKDVLAEVGYNAEDIASWDDFEEVANALKQQENVSPLYAAGKLSVGNITDWTAPGAFNEEDLKKMDSGTFLSKKYKSVLAMIAEWKKAGFFNADYSSATTDDMAKALAQGQTGFVFYNNTAATNALQYNPEAKLGFMPVPALNGSPSYLIGSETNAYGISKTTEFPDEAKAFIAFLAQPENESKMAKAAQSAPGLTNAKMDLGPLQASYDKFVTEAQTPLVPYFDRVHLPNGSWDALVTTTDGVVTGQSTVDSAVEQMENTFKSLYGQGE